MSDFISFIKAKKIIIIPVAVILVFFILRAVLLQKPDNELTYTVKQEDLVDTVQVSGTYTTASQTTVTSPSTGVISQLYVANGDYVTKGQSLFHITSTATTDQQNAAYADYTNALSLLQSAQNNVQSLDAAMWAKQQSYISAQDNQNYMNNNNVNPTTKQNYTDLEKFAINNAVTQTQKDFQASEQAYQTAGAAVTAAQAKVTQTKQAYAETQSATVTAPASGKVVNLQDQIGDSVTAPSTSVTIAGSSTGQASVTSVTPLPVLVIANLSDPYISVNIGEDYATRVAAGQEAHVVFDSLTDKTFIGTVSEIASVGLNTAGVVTYPARIVTTNLPSMIKPAMTALVTIETLRKDDVIDVPNSSIVTSDGASYVLEAKTHKHISVTLGEKGIAKTEITSGLDVGTVIVASPSD